MGDNSNIYNFYFFLQIYFKLHFQSKYKNALKKILVCPF